MQCLVFGIDIVIMKIFSPQYECRLDFAKGTFANIPKTLNHLITFFCDIFFLSGIQTIRKMRQTWRFLIIYAVLKTNIDIFYFLKSITLCQHFLLLLLILYLLFIHCVFYI